MDGLSIFGAVDLIWAIAIGGFVYMVQSRRRVHIALFTAVTLPAAYIVAKVCGWFYYDPRPFVQDGITPLITHAANNGFPSDHALLAMTIASIVFVYDKRFGVFLGALALCVAAGRVLVGVHHVVDVVASIVIAVVVVFLAYRFLPRTWR